MFQSRPASLFIACAGLWLLQLTLTLVVFAAREGWVTLGDSLLQWSEWGAVGIAALLGALLLEQVPRALQWRRRRSVRASPELTAERQRIARDLHDRLGSQLVSALVLVNSRQPPDRELLTALEHCMLDLRLIVDSMDAEHEPLGARLARLRHRLQPVMERRGIHLVWDVEMPCSGEQPSSQGTAHLVAIVQEALSNVLQHSGATQVAVSVRYVAAAALWQANVSDNGRGLGSAAQQAQGAGLAGMRQRARQAGGQLLLAPHPGGGTSVSATIPAGQAVV